MENVFHYNEFFAVFHNESWKTVLVDQFNTESLHKFEQNKNLIENWRSKQKCKTLLDTIM